jgi:hypothetical protein
MIPAAKQRDLFSRRYRTVVQPQQKEVAFHIQLVATLRWCLRPDVLFWHVPNGEHRDPRTAAKLKAMGVMPGISDLQFHWCELGADQQKCRRVLHLELKTGNRPQSPAQAAFALAMRCLGDEYHIARSVDEAIGILRECGLLHREVR